MTWPSAPAPGELVRVPLALPPMLSEALGYEGGARYVGFWWSPQDEAVRWSDGAASAAGYWLAWQELLSHPVSRAALAPFDLGAGATGGRHRLLADCWEESLHAGLPEDVEQLLATQPSVIAMAVDEVGEDRVREAIDEALRIAADRPRGEVEAAARERSRRQRELVAELRAWLDHCPRPEAA